MLKFLKQLFCRHDFELVDKDEEFPLPEPGTGISYVRPHICTKCNKTRNIGSGIIWG